VIKKLIRLILRGRWTGERYTKPEKNASQSMLNPSVTYDSGVLTLTFQRARNTGDDQDWTFSDADEHCYYFFFPVGGGTRTETDFYYHSTTPIISSQKICISKSVITLETTCVVYKVTHAGRRKIKHKALEPLMTKTLTLL